MLLSDQNPLRDNEQGAYLNLLANWNKLTKILIHKEENLQREISRNDLQ